MILHIVAWIFLVALVFGSCDVVFVHRLRGESVDIDCAAEKEAVAPTGLYLKHRLPPLEHNVAFVSGSKLAVQNHLYFGRVEVRGNVSSSLLTMSLSGLQHTDTGLYSCEFTCLGQSVPGTIEVFVMVVVPCGCSRYLFLLYTVSAVMCFLVLLVIGLSLAKFGKACRNKRQVPPVPIYEDMTCRKPLDLQQNT